MRRISSALGLLTALLAFEAGGAAEPALPFSKDLDGTLSAARAGNRPVVVVFVAAWCPHCRDMRRNALASPLLTARAEDFFWVMVDVDRSVEAARRYRVDAVPTIDVLDPRGRTLSRLGGALDPAEIDRWLTEVRAAWKSGRSPAPATVASPGPDTTLVPTPDGYRGRSICFSHVGYGPLALGSQSAFQALRLGMRPRTPSTLTRGQVEARQSATWVNFWAQGPGYFIDHEMLQLNAGVAYGLTRGLEVDVILEERARFGGAMDGFIQGFHDVFGIDQNGRDLVPKGAFTFDVDPPGDRPAVAVNPRDRGTFSRSLAVALQHNVTCGTRRLPAFSYAATARVETEDDDLGGGGRLDLGASIALARRVGSVHLYGTLGHVWFGSDRFFGLKLKDTQWSGMFAVEWRYLARQSLIVQYLVTEGLIPDFTPFSDPSNEVTIGWKWELVERGVLEVGLIENVVSQDNSPDFGLRLGFSRRF